MDYEEQLAEEIDTITLEGWRDQVMVEETRKAVREGRAEWIYSNDIYAFEHDRG